MNDKTEHILIIDDEPDIRELLEITLTRMGKLTHSAQNVQGGKQLLSEHKFDLCLTDMRLPDGNGIDLVKYISKHYPQTPVAMITAHGNMETAIEALKAGAFDFISKPVDLKTLRNLITTALKLASEENEKPEQEDLQLLGNSPVMQAMRARDLDGIRLRRFLLYGFSDAAGLERLQHQIEYFHLGLDAGMTVEFGADL